MAPREALGGIAANAVRMMANRRAARDSRAVDRIIRRPNPRATIRVLIDNLNVGINAGAFEE